MSAQNSHFEPNLHRLMRASIGPETHPSAESSEALRRSLSAYVRPRRDSEDFPIPILAALSGAVLIACAACLAAVLGFLGQAGLPAFSVPAVLVALNYLSLPIACVVIVLRRKYV